MGKAEQNDAEQLARRCEAIGWVVSRTRMGYRITAPTGTAGWHKDLSPASKPAVMRELRKLGFAEAEQALKDSEAKARVKALAADRTSNEVVTTEVVKAAAKATPVQRAAGEYAVYDDDSWALRKHPHPAVRQMIVTPALAGKILADHNRHNRPIKPTNVDYLAGAMRDKRFLLLPEGIGFDRTGSLMNGQHRLQGIVDSDQALPMFVFVGMDPRGQEFIDTQVKRGNNDALALAGAKQVTVLAAIIRQVYLLGQATHTNWSRVRVDNARATELWRKDPDGYAFSVLGATSMRNAKKGFSTTVLGAVLYVAQRGGTSRDLLEEWMQGYRTGESLGPGHPTLALRREADKYMEAEGHRPVPKIQLGKVIMAWNAFVEGRSMTSLVHRLDDPLPPIHVRTR